VSYTHLKLVKEDINLIRQGRPDRRRSREVIPSIHGKRLSQNFTTTKDTFEKTKKIGEDFIFKITKDSTQAVNYSKLGLELLATPNEKDVIVKVVNPIALESNLNDFTKEVIAKTKVVNYSDFANIDEFIFQAPEEKMGPLLKKINFNNEDWHILDIQLYVSDNSLKEIHLKVADFKDFLDSLNVELLDDCILQNLVILKIKIKGNHIIKLLEHKNVYVADLPQNSFYNLKGNSEISIDQLPNIVPPAIDAPLIGIIDSGILPTHPMLKGSIVDSLSFGSLTNQFDDNGHGTMVSGIVQLGDVYSTIKIASESKTPIILPFRLLNGKVTDKNNMFPDDKIVASVVKDAIIHFVEEYNCEIFNISLGDDRFPYVQNTKMDTWSFMLDELIHKYNIAIVVSAGNYTPLKNDESLLDYYIDYLLADADSTIIPPALSISSLTVGSTAKDDVPYSQKNKLTHVAIAKKDSISPFSRKGFGYAGSIKPETIAYGGNYSLNTHTKRINSNDKNLGIFSTSLFDSTFGSWFETRPGTSFAAPYITHLLGKIKIELPGAKGNLLRALLINATIRNTLTDTLIKEKFKKIVGKPSELTKKSLQLQGFGTIIEDRLLRSSENYVNLYYEGQIGINKVNVFEIPIPADIYIKKGKTKINITLAYNPPCRDTRIDYNGLKMTYQLYRGLTLEEIKRYTCKPDDDEFEKDKLPKDKQNCKCSLNPSITSVSKGTILRSTHEIAKSNKSAAKYGDTYYLVVKCQERWYSGPNITQNFAVVVSIEHENEEAHLYSELKQRVQSRVRRQSRTKV